jgi:hypothetical protein
MEPGGTRKTGLQGGLSFVTFLWPPKKSKETINLCRISAKRKAQI